MLSAPPAAFTSAWNATASIREPWSAPWPACQARHSPARAVPLASGPTASARPSPSADPAFADPPRLAAAALPSPWEAASAPVLAVAVGPSYRALILLGAYGGLRIGEMAGLRRKRLDLAAGVVEVAEVVTEMHGHLYLGPPKTTAGRRRVGLPRVVVEALQDHLADRSVEPDGFVFALSNGGPLRTANFRSRVWRPATRATGLEGLRIHDLRHTAVALWIAAGAGPKEVATRAGHTSVSFTLDRYGHLYPEADRALRDRLDRFHEVADDAE